MNMKTRALPSTNWKTHLLWFVQWMRLVCLAVGRRLRGMFNLNDGRWGRGPEQHNNASNGSDPGNNQQPPEGNRRPPPPGGPPDLDELWRDLNRKIGGLFGGSGNTPPSGSGGQGPFKNAGLGLGLLASIVVLVWLGTGFFIVQEGQQAVITQFGRYHSTVGAGINWRMPYPIQRHEVVFVTQIRSLDIGRDAIIKATGLRESAMLTEDENIVEIKFAVQYRLTDARAYLFESKNPTDAVVQAAETAVREVVGINLQQGGVRPPEQVQAAFDDVLKAGQERERAKNEAEAYANDVVPRAVGSASRLKQEADAYKARIVAQAQGDAQRFRSLYAEYQKAPQVTRDRLYINTMKEIYGNVTKVLVESRQGSNLLYLPLDKIMQMHGVNSTEVPVSANPSSADSANSTTNNAPAPANMDNNSRGRDSRQRDRDLR